MKEFGYYLVKRAHRQVVEAVRYESRQIEKNAILRAPLCLCASVVQKKPHRITSKYKSATQRRLNRIPAAGYPKNKTIPIFDFMLSQKQLTSISKFISLVLRHKPETIGLSLDKNGWADTAELVDKMNSNGNAITFEVLEHVVSTNSKKRFAFNDDKTKIRASQGHSVEVELQLLPVKPPAHLYHGTGEQSVSSILKVGLEKRGRQRVHLSMDKETAVIVGKRHGKPVVLQVDATTMYEEGFEFFLSDNKVWLTEQVPAKYLSLL